MMHARVAMFDGADPEQAAKAVEAGKQQLEEGFDSPPEGLEGAKEAWMFFDPSTGKSVGITLFETEEDLRRGHEALDAMSPADPEGARRTSVGFYQVAARKTRG
jgi:hypothetical protein